MSTATRQSTWDARIARARELASSHPAARDLLGFYAALAEYQRSVAIDAQDAGTFDAERVVAAIPGLLAWLRNAGKSDLAEAVDIDCVTSVFRGKSNDSRSLPPDGGSHPSGVGVTSGDPSGVPSPAERFVIESLLQAFAGQLVIPDPSPGPGSTPMRCPRCGALPVVAVLREEGHGARRSLLCALCLTEWECLRIVCPSCGEQDRDQLPIYTAEQFAHVRIDACDRCHQYIKTIDLTRDGRAVPCVDDIASVSLDLWAREQGYTRIHRNVLGI
ncbi:MAG TPA: formate dehydrogenase accessory protein FdhE [Vicinamibacterales bacterium]|nr:formate dehydrogenase accessory protein FdhE [Vicinamibacterales bacterium]